MATGIEYVDETWNPVTGCTKVSPGCQNCYAERMARRLAGRFGYPKAPHHFDVTLHPDRLDEPLRRKKPTRYLTCSMGDLFHDDVPLAHLASVFGVAIAADWHTFLILTKRPKRMREFVSHLEAKTGLSLRSFRNIWLGVTVENQDEMWRVEELLKIPGAKHWVSLEPMLGPIDIAWAVQGWHAETGTAPDGSCIQIQVQDPSLDWVVLGGETGPGARPCRPDWARRVRDDCSAAGVDFWFKGWGAWLPASQYLDALLEYGYYDISKSKTIWLDDETVYRVGKKAAGRLLDGREWNEMPDAEGGKE